MTDSRFTLHGLLLYISFITSYGRAQCVSSCCASIPYNYDIKNVWCVPGAFKTMASVNPCPGVQVAQKGFSLPTVCSTVNQNGYTQVCPTPRGICNSITQQNAVAVNEASGNCYSNIKTPVIPLNAVSQETRIAMKKSPGNYMYPDIPKPFKATIHACLAGYDGEIFQIINEIKKTTGTEIEVHFYLFHQCKFNHLGSHLTNVKCLQEVLARYHHYICLNKKYVETYSEKEHCWYIEKLIMIPAFHREVDLLEKNIPIQDFTKICDVSNEKTGFEPLVLEIDEKVGDKKDMQKIKETENKYEICIDHIKDICENKVGVNNEICTKSSQDNYGILDASLDKNQMMQPVNFQGNSMAQKLAVTTDQSQNIYKNVNSPQNGYVVARKQAQQNIGYDFKYGFGAPGFGNNVYTTKPYTIVQDSSKIPMSYSNGIVCNVPCGNKQSGQVQKANLWYKNVPNTNVEMPFGYNVNNNKNDQRMFPCYKNNVFSSYINNQNNVPASNICKYETENPTNIVDKLTSDSVKLGSIIPNLIPLKVNKICQTMNNVITSPINDAIRNIPCSLIVPGTRNVKSVSSESNKNLNYVSYSKPCPNVCQWANYGLSNTQTQKTGQFKYNTVVPKAAIQTERPTVCSNQVQPCMINQKLGYSTVVPYSPIVKIDTPSYGSTISYMQPCIASQGSQKSANQAYITSHTLSKTPVPICGSISSNTQKNAWPVPESVTVCYTQPAKIPICASSLYSTQNQQNIQKSIWPLQYSGTAKVCHAQSSKSVAPEFVCAPPSVSENISPQKSFKQICDSNSFYSQRQNSRQSGYQQTFVTPQRICLSPGIWQKQGYRTTVPYTQPTYFPSAKAVLPQICAEPAVTEYVKQNSGPATTYVKAQKNTKANYNTLTAYMQPEQGSAQEYNIGGSGYLLSDNRASTEINGYNKICSYKQAQNSLGSEFWTSLSQRPAKICASSNVGVAPRYDAISTYTQPLNTRMQSEICYAPGQKSMRPQNLDYDIIGSYTQPPKSTQPEVTAIFPFEESEQGTSPQTGVKDEYVSIVSQTPKSKTLEYGSIPTQIGVKPNNDKISGYTPCPKSVQSNYIPLESKQKTEQGNYESVSVQMPRNRLNIGHDTVTFSPKSGISEKAFPRNNLYTLPQVKYQKTPMGQYTGTPGQAVWPNYQNVPLYTSNKNGPNDETYNTMSDYTPGEKRMQLEKDRNNVIDSYSSPPKNEGQVYEFVDTNKPLQAKQFSQEVPSSANNAVTKKEEKPDLDVISSYASKPYRDVVDSYNPNQDSLKNNYDKVPIGTSVVRPIQPTHTSITYVPSKGYKGIPPEVRNAYNTIAPYAQPQRKITPDYVSLLPCDQKRTSKPDLKDYSQDAVSGIPPEIGSAYDTISSYTKPQRRITPDYVSLLPCDQKRTLKPGLIDHSQGAVSRISPEIGSTYETISSYTKPQRRITADYISYRPCDGSKPGSNGPTQSLVSGIPPEIGSAYDTISSYTQPQRSITPDYVSYGPCYGSNPGLKDPTQGILPRMPPEIGKAYDKISYTQPHRRITIPDYVSVLPSDQKLSSKLGFRDPTQDSVSRIPAEIGSAYDKIPSYSQPQRSITPDHVLLLPCDQKLISKSGFRVPTQDSVSGIPRESGSAYDTITSYTKPQRKITPDYVPLLPCGQKLISKSGLRDSSQVVVSGIQPEVGGAYDTISSYTQPQRRITPDYVSLLPCDQKLTSKAVLRGPLQDSLSTIPPEIGSAYDTISSYTQPQRRIIPNYVSLLPCDQKLTSKTGLRDPLQGSVSRIPPEIGSAYDTIPSYTQTQRRITPDYVSLLSGDQKLISKPSLKVPTQDSVSGIPPEIGSAYETISSYTKPQRRIAPDYVSVLPCDQKLFSIQGLRDLTQDSVSKIPPEINSAYDTITSYTEPQRRITPDFISLLPCAKRLSSKLGLGDPSQDSVSRIPAEIGSAHDKILSYSQPQRITTPDYVSLLPCDQKLISKSGLRDTTQDSASGVPPEIGSAYDTISSYTQPQRRITNDNVPLLPCDEKLIPKPGSSDSSQGAVSRLPSEIGSAFDTIPSYTQPQRSIRPNYVSLLPCDKKLILKPGLRVPTQDSESGVPSEIGSAYDTISSYTQPQRRITPNYISYRPCDGSKPDSNGPTQGIVSEIPPEIGSAYDTISSYTQPPRKIKPDYVSLLPCDQKLSSKLGLRAPTHDSVSGIPPEIGSVYDKIPSYTQPQRKILPDYVSILPCDQKLTSKPGSRVSIQDSVSGIPSEIGTAFDTIPSYTQPQRRITPDYILYRPCDGSNPGLKNPTQGTVSGIPPDIGRAYDKISSYTQPQRRIIPNYVSLLPCDHKRISNPGLRVPTHDSLSGIPPEIGSAYDIIPSYTQPQRKITSDYVSLLPCDHKLISKPGLRVPTQDSVSGIPSEIGSAYDTISSYTQPQRKIIPDYVSLLPCDQKLISKSGARVPIQNSVYGIPAEIGSAYDTISSYTQPQRRITPDFISYRPCDGSKLGSKDPTQGKVSVIPPEIGSAYDTISSYTQPQRKITRDYVSWLPCDQKLSSQPGLTHPLQDSVSRIPPDIGSAYDKIPSYSQPQKSITPDYVSLLPSDQKLIPKSGFRVPTQDTVSGIPQEIGSAYDTISSYTQPQKRIPDNVSLLPYNQKLPLKLGLRNPTQDSVSGIPPDIGSAYDTISSYTQPQRSITPDYVSSLPCGQKPSSIQGLRDPAQIAVSRIPPEISSVYDTISSYTQPQRRITPDYVSLLPCDQKLSSIKDLRDQMQGSISRIPPETGSAYDTVSSYTQPQRRITPDYVSLLPCDQKLTPKLGLRDSLQRSVSRMPPEIGSAYNIISSYTQPQKRIPPDYISYRPCDGDKSSKGSSQGIVSGIPSEIGSAYDTISSYTQPQRRITPDQVSSLPSNDDSSSRPQYDSRSRNAEEEYEKIPAYTDYPSHLSRIEPRLHNGQPGFKPDEKGNEEFDNINSYTQKPKSITPVINVPCSPAISALENLNAIPSYTQQPRSFKNIYDKIAPHLQYPKTTNTGYEPLINAQPSVPPQRIKEKYDFIPSYTSQPKRMTPGDDTILSYTKPCVTPKVTQPGTPGYDSVVSYIQPQKRIQLEYGNPEIMSPEFVSFTQPCLIPKDVQQNYDSMKSYSQYPKNGKQVYDSVSSYTQPLSAEQRYEPTASKKANLDKISSYTQYPKTIELEYSQPVVTAKDYNTISRYTPSPVENYDTVTTYAETPKSTRPIQQSVSSYSRPCLTPKKSTQQEMYDQIPAYTKDNSKKEDYPYSQYPKNVLKYEPTVFEEPCAAPVKESYDTIDTYTKTPEIQDQETDKSGYGTIPSYAQPCEQKSKPTYNTVQYTQSISNKLQQQVYMQNHNIRQQGYIPVSYIKPKVCTVKRIRPICNKISSYTPIIRRVRPRYESIQYTKPKLSPEEVNQPYDSIASYNQVPNVPYPKPLNPQSLPILSYIRPCLSKKKGMFVIPRYQSIPSYTKQIVLPKPRYDHIQSYSQPSMTTQPIHPDGPNQPCNYQSIPSYTKQILPLKPKYNHIESYSQPSVTTQPIYPSKQPCPYQSIPSYTKQITPMQPRHDNIQTYTQPGVATKPLYQSKQPCTPPCAPEVITSYKTMSQKPIYDNIQSYTQPTLPIEPLYPIRQPCAPPCLPDIINAYETLANNVYMTPVKKYVEFDNIKAYEPQENTRQRYNTDPAKTAKTTAPTSEPILQYTRPSAPMTFNNENYNTIGSYTQPQRNINDISEQIMSYTRPLNGKRIYVAPQTSNSQNYDTIGSYTQAPKAINDIGDQIRAYTSPENEKQTYVTSNGGNIQDNDIIASYTQPPKSMKDICDQIMSYRKPQTETATYVSPSITNNQYLYNQQQENIKDICSEIKSYIKPLENQKQYDSILKYLQSVNDGKQLSDTISAYEETLKNAERVCDEIESYKNIRANEMGKQDNDQIYSFAQPWQEVNNQIPQTKLQVNELYDQISAYTEPPTNLNPISEYINAPTSPNQKYGQSISYLQPQKMASENYDTISSYAQPRERVVAPCVPLQKITQPIIDRINSYTQPTKDRPCMLQQESLYKPYDTISDYTKIPNGEQMPLQEIYDNIPSYTQPSVKPMPYVTLQKLTPSKPCIPLQDTVSVPYIQPQKFKQTHVTIPAYTSIPKSLQRIVPRLLPQERPKEICDKINSYTQPLISENVYIPHSESYRGTQSVDAPITTPEKSQGQVFEAITSYTKPRQSEQVIVPCVQSHKPGTLVDVSRLPQESAQRVCVPWTVPEQRGRKIHAPWVSEQKLEPSICVPYTMTQESRKQVCIPCTSYEKGGQETVPCVPQLLSEQPIYVSYQKPQNSFKQIYDTIQTYRHAPKIPVCLPYIPSSKPAPQICKPCIPPQKQQVCVPLMPLEKRLEKIRFPCQESQTSLKQAHHTISAYIKPPKREQVLPYLSQQDSRSPVCIPCTLQKPSGQVCMPCMPQLKPGQVFSPCMPRSAIELPGKSFKQMYDTISAYTQPPKNRPQMRLPYGTQEFGGQVYEPYISPKPSKQVCIPCLSTYKPSSQICVPCVPGNIGQKVSPCQPPQKSFKEVYDAISAYKQPREMGRVYEPCLPWEKRQQVCEPCIPGQPISVPFIQQKSGPSVCVPCVPQVDGQKFYAPCQTPQKSIKEVYDAITAYTQKLEIGRAFEPCMPQGSGSKVCMSYIPQDNKQQVYVPCVPQLGSVEEICVPCIPTQKARQQICIPCVPQANGQQVCIPCIPQEGRQKVCIPCVPQDNRQQVCVPCIPQNNGQKVCAPCQPPEKSFKEVYDAITAYTQSPEIGRAFEPCIPQKSGLKVCLPCIPQDNKQRVCVPCVPQLGSVEEICVPCIPTQKPRQQIVFPCLPQANGQQVCMPCVPQAGRQEVCIPCIPQDSRQQICVPCIPQDNGQKVCIPCIPGDYRQQIRVPCIPQDNAQKVCIPCIPGDYRQQVCVPCILQESRQKVCIPCIPQVNRQQVRVPCQPPKKSFKEVYGTISAYTQPPESGRVCEPCIPTPNSGHQVCVPCVPQLGSVEEICVPCSPSQKPIQQICVPCIPQVHSGKQVCWPCVSERSGLVCEPCIPQKSGQVCVPCMPCIPQDKRQQVCVPCVPQDNTQVCVPCIPQDNAQVCVPCIPQDNRQRVCMPCIPQTNRQQVCVPCISLNNKQQVCLPCIPQKTGQGVCMPCLPQDNTQVCTPCVPWSDSNQQISDTVPTYTEPQKTVTQNYDTQIPYLPQNPYDTPNSQQGLDTKPTEGQQDTNNQKPNDEATTTPKSLIDCLKECISKYVASNPNIKNELYNNVGIGDLNNITLDSLAVLTNFENKTAFMTKTIGRNIELKGFMNKVKIIRPKLVLETQEIEVPNFIPVVKRNENRCQCVIQGLAKAVVKTAYSQPVVIKKPSTMDNGYMMVKDHGVSSSNAIIWPAVYQDNAWYKESKDCVCH